MPTNIARSSASTTDRAARGAGSCPHLTAVLQEGRENANIHANSGVIWRIPVKIFLIFAFAFFLFTLVGVFYVVRGYFKIRRSEKWLTTNGKVTQSEVIVEKVGDPMLYRTKIDYSYEANGAELTSDRFDLDGESTSAFLDKAEQVRLAYPKDASVVVHYNPDNPAEAVLHLNNFTELRSEAKVGAFFACICLVFLGVYLVNSIYLSFAIVGALILAALFHRWTKPILLVMFTKEDGYTLYELRKGKR
jgi:hypothetical protein